MSDTVNASVQFNDEETIAELEEAADEYGSRSEAIRAAVRAHYAEDDGVVDGEDTGLPVKAREGHRKLVEWTGHGGRIELGTAESILANHLNIQKDAVRKVVIHPLKREGVIALHQGIHHVSIVVGKIDSGTIVAGTEDNSTTSNEATATDGGEARERLDKLAAAGEEVANGK